MNKKNWSYILLCLIAISFLLMIILCVNTGMTLYGLENNKIDSSNEVLPGASIIGLAMTWSAVWAGFLFFGFGASSLGFISSLACRKISTKSWVKKISSGFLFFYSVVLIIIICISVYFLIKLF